MLLMDTRHTDLNDTPPHSELTQGAVPSLRPPLKNKKFPERTCIATRAVQDKADLLRFVCDKDGTLFFDHYNKLPGRGLYVSADQEALQTAIQKNLFAKAAKRAVKIPDNFLSQIEVILRRSALDHVNLARRSSDILYNFEKIKKYIQTNKLGCYITSSSKDSDAYKKLVHKVSEHNTPIITLFSADELNSALGLEKIAHIAFKPTPLCDKFLILISKINNLKETRET